MKRKRSPRKRKYRVKKKKPFFKKKSFWVFVLFLLVSAALFYFFIFSQNFQIKEIKIFGNEKVLNEELQQIVESGIEREIVFPTQTIFLVNLSEIEKQILDEFPQIERAKLKRKFPNSLILEVKERTPLAIFCQDSENCFKIDKQGIAFERNGESSYLTIYSQKKGDIFLGKKVVEADLLKSIFEIQRSFRQDLKIEIEKFSLFDERLNVKTVDGFEIYFNLKGNISEQIFNLDLTLQEKIPPENRGSLQYIDLRFGNRVYFK